MNKALTMLIIIIGMHGSIIAEEEVFHNDIFTSVQWKSSLTYRFRLTNGDNLTAQFKEKGETILRADSTMLESIIVTSLMGDITLYADEIQSIDILQSAYKQNAFLYIMPTADPIGNNAFFSLTQLLFPQIGYGFEDFSISGGITVIPGLSFAEQGKHVHLKYTFYREEQDIIPGHYTLAGGYTFTYANTVNLLQHAYMVGTFHMPKTTLTTMLFYKTGSQSLYSVSTGTWNPFTIQYSDGALGFALGFDISLHARSDTRALAELWCADIMRPRNSAGFIGLRLHNDRYSMDAGLAMFTAPAIIPAVKFQWSPF